MKRQGLLLAALASAARLALAGPAQFTAVVDEPRPMHTEDVAVMGFTLLDEGASNAHAVGGIGRAYSLSAAAGNTVWGLVSEAVNLPSANGNVVGIESGVGNMNPANDGQLRGLDVVFKNRADVDFGNAVPVVGLNRYNENSSAVYVSSQPRSSAGEYSGWQAGIRFAPDSLDRTASVPYAAAIDISEANVPATFYLIVWRCGKVKCGLKPTDSGAVIVRDIDSAQ